MTVNLSALAGAGAQFFDNNGVILSGGKLYSYAAGTTTPQTTYTSASGVTAHTNPIILNSAGRVATGEIWLTSGNNYKFVLYTSADVLIATWDNINGINGTGISTNAIFVEYDPPFTNAVATTVADKLSQYISVKDFGAIGNGIADDTAEILAACVAANAAGIQNVLVPPGTYNHTTLDLTDLNVRLVGSGVESTILKYTGANTSDGIKFGTSQNATLKVNGVGLQQITVNANALARRAVEVTSVYGAVFESVAILNPYAYGMYWTCLNNRVFNAPGNDPADNQRCFTEDLYVECVTVPTAVAIFLDGNAGALATTGANTSLNHFQNIRLNIRNGNGLVFGFADGNTLISFFVFRPLVNTGIGLVFDEDTTGNNRNSRHNLCYNVQAARSGVLAKGSGVGQASNQNAIFGFNLGNGGVDNPPVVQTAATLAVWTNIAAYNLNTNGVAVLPLTGLTQASAYTPAVRARMVNESIRIANNSNNHIRLERGNVDYSAVEGEWGINVIAASGSAGQNLRVSRVTGTGVFEIASIATATTGASAGTTTLTNQSTVVIANAALGNCVINLPSAASYAAGRSAVIQIRRIDGSANTVTVFPEGSDTLNGTTSETLGAAAGKTYVSNAVNAWYSF